MVESQPASTPNKGGTSNIPTLQKVICIPTSDCETSFPKKVGVRWVKCGNTGPLPKPISISAMPFVVAETGKNSKVMPAKIKK